MQARCGSRLSQVTTCAGALDLKLVEDIQRIEQPGTAPIENVVVAENAAVDARSSEATKAASARFESIGFPRAYK
jgi:hypothetical protein